LTVEYELRVVDTGRLWFLSISALRVDALHMCDVAVALRHPRYVEIRRLGTAGLYCGENPC
jgi:hypothetical protein